MPELDTGARSGTARPPDFARSARCAAVALRDTGARSGTARPPDFARSARCAALIVAAFCLAPTARAEPGRRPPMTPNPDALQEMTVTLNHTLGRPFSFKFLPDGRTLLFLRSGQRDRDTRLYSLDLSTFKEREIASAEALLGGGTQETAAERAARERKRIKLAGLADFQVSSDGRTIVLSTSGRVFWHDIATGRTARVQLPEGELADPRLSPDGQKLAFVLDYDLYVAHLGSIGKRQVKTKVTRLTRGGSALNPNGVAEFVAQEEMSRHQGYWWSPDSDRLLYQSTDQSKLDNFTIANAASPEQAPEVFPYPRAGRDNADVRLFVVRISGRGRTEVRWNRTTYPYVAKVEWPATQAPTVLVQARDQRAQVYLRIDLRTGSTSKLHEERDDAWLNIHDSTPWWLSDGSYLWAAEDEGAWALYRYEPRARRAGVKRRTPIVGPEAGFAALLHVDENAGRVWFAGGPDPTEQHVWCTTLDGTTPPQSVTSEHGHYEAVLSPNGEQLVLTRAALDQMPESRLFASADLLVKDDKRPAGRKIPQTSSKPRYLPMVEHVPADKAGGFHAAIVRPRKFDPKRQYPVILYVYGGPGVQVVRSIGHYYMVHQWMADHGFIVVALDGRGTPRRGRAYERALRLNFSDVPLDDQVKGLTALGEHYPELDLDRVGIYGWSYGGYLAALGALKRPDIFKVAVAGAPVVDWTYYDTHYTERYLGLPQDEPEAYRQANLLTYAKGLKTPLLLIHGIADDNVYFAHTLRLADALFRAGKRFQLIPLVGLTHQVSDPKVREVLYEQIVTFMGDVLW